MKCTRLDPIKPILGQKLSTKPFLSSPQWNGLGAKLNHSLPLSITDFLPKLDGGYKATMNNFALHTSHILQPTLTCPLVVTLPVDGCTAATSEVLHAPTAVDSEQRGPPSPDPFTSNRNFELLWKWREIQNEMLQHGSKSVKRKAEVKICAFWLLACGHTTVANCPQIGLIAFLLSSTRCKDHCTKNLPMTA